MTNVKQNKINRRNFLRTMGAMGLGATLAHAKAEGQSGVKKEEKPKFPQVPKRKLGKTGVKVPSLSLGGNYSLTDKQVILKRALVYGIDCWDTAPVYAGGDSELGMGEFWVKNADLRKKLFIVNVASRARTVTDVEDVLQTSLKRMNTKYFDLYLGVHMLSDPAQLTDELKQWAKSAKKRKLIRFFGFSTHSNMAKCLAAAAKLDWIDVVMTRYSFQMMDDDQMQAAIDACHKAGVGLIAIKTLGRGQRGPRGRLGRRGPRRGLDGPKGEGPGGRPNVPGRSAEETQEDMKLLSHFLKRGFTEGQAKLKFVLEDKRLSSVCVGMQNLTLLTSNVAVSLDKTKLSQTDVDVLREYAQATCNSYCAGCAHICDSALTVRFQQGQISDIMRYLMYYNSYGEKKMAKELFAEIPRAVLSKLLSTNYSTAEARCPQHLPIGELVDEAVSKLA
jgi:aryl-alcohol dehydrogenase-like predicted oxidoreductase